MSYDTPQTIQEIVELFLEAKKASVTSDTHEYYARLLSMAKDRFHSVVLTQRDINEYVAQRATEGARRTIAKELSCLRMALRFCGIVPNWDTPKSVHAIPKKSHWVASPLEVQTLLSGLSPDARLALFLALLAGLRDAEVYRVRVEDYKQSEGILVLPGSIRKTGIGNMVPVVELLRGSIGGSGHHPEGTTIVQASPSSVRLELKNASRQLDHLWSGLQPARRCLVTWAEDAGFTMDTIALVTGHARGSMTSRYSSEYGRLDIKRRVLESVERRLTV